MLVSIQIFTRLADAYKTCDYTVIRENHVNTFVTLTTSNTVTDEQVIHISRKLVAVIRYDNCGSSYTQIAIPSIEACRTNEEMDKLQ